MRTCSLTHLLDRPLLFKRLGAGGESLLQCSCSIDAIVPTFPNGLAFFFSRFFFFFSFFFFLPVCFAWILSLLFRLLLAACFLLFLAFLCYF